MAFQLPFRLEGKNTAGAGRVPKTGGGYPDASLQPALAPRSLEVQWSAELGRPRPTLGPQRRGASWRRERE